MGSRGPLSQPKIAAAPKRKAVVVPPVPESLPPALGIAWTNYWSSEVAEVTQPIDLPMIHRLFGLYAQHMDATDVVSKGLVVKGSMGQVRVNPLADHLLKLETAILRLENELGLTPMSRARLGIFLKDVTEDRREALSIIDELAARRAIDG